MFLLDVHQLHLVLRNSLLVAGLNTLLMLSMSTPRDKSLSHLYLSTPSASSDTDTRQTWAESMACSCIPFSAQSQVPCLINSFRDSTTFLKRLPATSRAYMVILPM